MKTKLTQYEFDSLTPEQKQEIYNLHQEAAKVGKKIGHIAIIQLVAGCALVIAVNTQLNSSVFVFIMAILTAFCVVSMTKNTMREEQEKIAQKFNSIISS